MKAYDIEIKCHKHIPFSWIIKASNLGNKNRQQSSYLHRLKKTHLNYKLAKQIRTQSYELQLTKLRSSPYRSLLSNATVIFVSSDFSLHCLLPCSQTKISSHKPRQNQQKSKKCSSNYKNNETRVLRRIPPVPPVPIDTILKVHRS
jgi:hypothetical protein